jgi:hypothetical protein
MSDDRTPEQRIRDYEHNRLSSVYARRAATAGKAYRSRRSMTCPRCGSVFTDPAVYRQHLREPHSSDQ